MIADRAVSKHVALGPGSAHRVQPNLAKTSAGGLPDKLELAVRCDISDLQATIRSVQDW